MKKQVGRPTKYTPELARQICEAIATSTYGTKRLCNKYPHWPSQDTLFAWLKNHKEFSEQYAQAKKQQVEVLVDEMLEIVQTNERTSSSEQIHAARLRVDVYKWLACKLVPRVYGDKIKHETEIGVRHEDAVRQLE